MKKCYVLIAALFFTLASQAQEAKKSGKVVRTEPNGIVVYEAQGVEAVEEVRVVPQPIVRQEAPKFSELTVPELEERLRHTDAKLAKAIEDENAEAVERYTAGREEVLERIKLLNGSGK
jgi:uncharacterized protein YqiB (DUF1249 family)